MNIFKPVIIYFAGVIGISLSLIIVLIRILKKRKAFNLPIIILSIISILLIITAIILKVVLKK